MTQTTIWQFQPFTRRQSESMPRRHHLFVPRRLLLATLLIASQPFAPGCGADDSTADVIYTTDVVAPDTIDVNDAADTAALLDTDDPDDAVDDIMSPDADTSPDTGPDPDAAIAEAADTICTAQAEWLCRAQSLCSCPGEPDELNCRSTQFSRCAERLVMFASASEVPLRVQPNAVEACAAAWDLDAVDCGPLAGRRFDSACGVVLVADVRLNAPCAQDGLPCANGDGICADGECKPLPVSGEPCDSTTALPCSAGGLCVAGRCVDAPLAAGSGCESNDQCPSGHRCVDSVCTLGAGAGETCDTGTRCTGALQCVDGLCIAPDASACTAPGPSLACGEEGLCGAASSSRCVAPGGPGSACTSSEQCEAGTWCNGASGLCEEAAASGEPCSDAFYCAAGLACDARSTVCGPLPVLGQPCALGPLGPFTCAEGLACVDRLCAPIPVEGERCAGGLVCVGDLGCAFEGDASYCRPRRPAGAPCDNDSICEPGTHCDFGRGQCATDFPDGTPCSLGNECGPDGACLPDASSALSCAPQPREGDACLLSCQSGLICQTTLGAFGCFDGICGVLE